jgi:hypothetical protein
MVGISILDQCETCYYRHVSLFESMRDTLIRAHLPFSINARRTTMGASPFSMKREMRVYYTCLPFRIIARRTTMGMSPFSMK